MAFKLPLPPPRWPMGGGAAAAAAATAAAAAATTATTAITAATPRRLHFHPLGVAVYAHGNSDSMGAAGGGPALTTSAAAASTARSLFTRTVKTVRWVMGAAASPLGVAAAVGIGGALALPRLLASMDDEMYADVVGEPREREVDLSVLAAALEGVGGGGR
ncbi:hypothetical protein MMPV_003902 [Pyropia vietnamensis]